MDNFATAALLPVAPGEEARKRERFTLVSQPHQRLGDILIGNGLVTREDVESAVSSTGKQKVGEKLVELGLVTHEQLLAALATKFGIPFVDLSDVAPSADALKAVPKPIAEKMSVFPIKVVGKQLVVATSEPTNSSIPDSLRFVTNHNIEVVVATAEQIGAAITMHYGSDDSLQDLISDIVDEPVVVKEEEEEVGSYIEPDSKVIKLVNKILLDAFNSGVSDIHFEPELGDGPLTVRYRVDGECRVCFEIPSLHKYAVIARLKIMSKLDIAERRRPQSGKIVLLYNKRKLEYRIEVTPTVEGLEDAVLRLLTSTRPLSLEEIGFSELDLERFRDAIAKPYGMILCVGPTGSGKTTTVHSALASINSPGRKIWTAEDPVEIIQKGLRQVQVNHRIGYGFDEAMRSFLRADPDVIMIGEMRDFETSKTAISASLTGHLVFSTLHTNSAAETVARLIEMGLSPYHLADALVAVVAQRLTRRLCPDCKSPYHPSCEEYQLIVDNYGESWFNQHGMPGYSDDLELMAGTGCPECGGTGYRGRIALHELLVGSRAVKKGIKENMPVEDLTDLALREGMRTLKMDGIAKVFQGVTDLQQVLKVCIA